MVGFTQGLASPSAQPPTPPKESILKPMNSNEGSANHVVLNPPLLDTPDESPSSSADYFKQSSERARKKVGFSPWTQFHGASAEGTKDSDSESSVRRLPPSRDCKSLKSILKAGQDDGTSSPGKELIMLDQTSLAAMLRATTLHLAHPSRASRMDAYTTLLGCLGAYDDVPEAMEMSEKVVDMAGYIKRDISAKLESDGNLDTQLVAQALKVLTALISIPIVAGQLPDDFRSFILDRSLSVLEDVAAPKILVLHYMHFLETQKLGPKQLTSDRANRIVSALDGVTNRVKGNRIVCHRLMIYQRLLGLTKSVMAARIGSWIDHLISGMLSTIKDVRIRAITFGTSAGLQLGTMHPVSQAFIEVLNRASPEGRKVVEFLASRLTEMVSSKEDGLHVAQIWSVVILFLRGRRFKLETWEHMKSWLGIIQKCFNSSEANIKVQANIAWSRLIFSINLDASTSPAMARMLRQPLMAHLERKVVDKSTRQAKQNARSTYCTLLYYAFRPSATAQQFDKYWDLYVASILPISFAANKSDVNYACDILAGLLSGPAKAKAKAWDENRANENGMVKIDELPYIDAKWVRSNVGRVMQTYDKLSEQASWLPDKDHEASILLLWRNFMTALGAAGSKEIKVSMETMQAISHVMNQCKRTLGASRHPSAQNTTSGTPSTLKKHVPDAFEKVRRLVEEAMLQLGTIPFLERRLVLTSQDRFEAAETPSSRSNKHSGSLESPITHLILLLLRVAGQQGNPGVSYVDTVKAALTSYLQPTTTRRAQLDAIRHLARLLSNEEFTGRKASQMFWIILAEATTSALKLPPIHDPYATNSLHPGHDFRDATKILELGIQYHSPQLSSAWVSLHESVTALLHQEAGAGGISLIMTELLASALCKYSDTCDDHVLIAATSILRSMNESQAITSLDRAQRVLWGPTPKVVTAKRIDLSGGLDAVMNSMLEVTYQRFRTFTDSSVMEFLTVVKDFVDHCPPSRWTSLLEGTQQGLALWFKDAENILDSSDPNLVSSTLITKLWTSLVKGLKSNIIHDTDHLFRLQRILTSALGSRHRSVVMVSIEMWNTTFGNSDSLKYPEELHKHFLKLRLFADIHLPEFPEPAEKMAFSPPRWFTGHQDDAEDLHSLSKAAMPSPKLARSTVHTFVKSPVTYIQRPAAEQGLTLSSPLRKRVATPQKARLRHNDSQVEFAAIESSPLASGMEESQYLTDRQKEVRQRQGLEAAMFPEIRSSPISAPRKAEYTLPKLNFRSNQEHHQKVRLEEETSPVYPPDILMNDFLGSSPTPASGRKDHVVARPDDDPTSSPPLVSSNLQKDRGETSPDKINAIEPKPVEQLVTRARTRTHGDDADPAALVNANNDADGQDISSLKEVPHPTNDRIMSDIDVFVDATTELSGEVNRERQEDEAHKNNITQNADRGLPTYDDQVTAQLVSEMERASSQQSNMEEVAVVSSPQKRAKRKATSDGDLNPNKRARTHIASSAAQGVSEIPKAGETVAECVMIGVRQIKGSEAAGPVQIKRERSSSPSLIVNTQPLLRAETPTARKEVGRPTRRSRSQHSGQETSSGQSPHVTASRRSTRRREASTSSPQRSPATVAKPAGQKPGSVTKTGKIRASMRWFWSAEEPETSQNLNPETNSTDLSPDDVEEDETAVKVDKPAELQDSEHAQSQPKEQAPATSDTDTQKSQSEDTESMRINDANRNVQIEAPRPTADAQDRQPTAEGILEGFKAMLNNIKKIALGREEERAMVAVLFKSVEEVHEAGRRSTAV